MRASDLKYLFAYVMPLAGWISISYNGLWSFSGVMVTFIILPIIEQTIPADSKNEGISDQPNRNNHWYFDALLFVNLPIVAFLCYLFGTKIFNHTVSSIDLVGKTMSLGIILGSSGINVAHELGHKSNLLSKIFAKLLLLPSHYTHFTIQHNRGHHPNVGTPMDPATALRDESLYRFWLRCVPATFIQAWQLEATKLKRDKKPYFSLSNEMLLNTAMSIIYVCAITYWIGSHALYLICAGVVSFLMLETINYIEHYGLTRKLKSNGKYEQVESYHSWNSNHQLGRILLYELTRHADHHFKESKKYQTLVHHDASPQLPYGYPASMVISLVPSLWFSIMHPVLDKINSQH